MKTNTRVRRAKDSTLWQIVIKSGPKDELRTYVSDFAEAIRIADLAEGSPDRLMQLMVLRALGKELDRDFAV